MLLSPIAGIIQHYECKVNEKTRIVIANLALLNIDYHFDKWFLVLFHSYFSIIFNRKIRLNVKIFSLERLYSNSYYRIELKRYCSRRYLK